MTEPQFAPEHTPIAQVQYRHHTRVAGRVHAMRVQPWSGVATLECLLKDDTGTITLVFLGRRTVPGIQARAHLSAEGMVGQHAGRLAILNPAFEITAEPQHPTTPATPHT
jgi:RecG-like helicase